jgi:hypothetical protein
MEMANLGLPRSRDKIKQILNESKFTKKSRKLEEKRSAIIDHFINSNDCFVFCPKEKKYYLLYLFSFSN